MLLIVALAAAIVWAGGATTEWLDWACYAARLRVVERSSGGGERVARLSVPYRGATRGITVRLPDALLEAEREVPTVRVFGGTGAVRDAYVMSTVRTVSEGAAVGALADELRHLRDRLGLDSDEYLELLARTVQSIPYGTAEWQIRLPGTVLEDGVGVCTEKSVLLSALLLHEGYDCGVWIFDTQRHVGVAVRGDGVGFQGGDYAFIETTRPAFVNEYDDDLDARGTFVVPPHLVRVGGDLPYWDAARSAYVASALRRACLDTVRLSGYRRYVTSAPVAWRSVYAALADDHDRATRRVAWIRANMDDLDLVFRTLADTGGPR